MNYDPVVQDPITIDKEFPPSLRSVILHSNGCKILGTMFMANGAGPHPTVLLLHGFPGNEHNFDLAHSIRRMGWNVFTFHYRGMWGSEGDFSWNNVLEDVNTASEFLKSKEAPNEYRVDNNRLVLVGYSMGGFAALMHAAKDENIKNVAAIAGYNFGLVAEMIDKVPNGKETALEHLKLGVSFINGTTKQKLLDELLTNTKEYNLLNYVDTYARKNVLMVGAAYDTTAPKELHYYPLIKKIEEKKSNNLITKIIETGHGFSTKRIELAYTIIDWLKKIRF